MRINVPVTSAVPLDTVRKLIRKFLSLPASDIVPHTLASFSLCPIHYCEICEMIEACIM